MPRKTKQKGSERPIAEQASVGNGTSATPLPRSRTQVKTAEVTTRATAVGKTPTGVMSTGLVTAEAPLRSVSARRLIRRADMLDSSAGIPKTQLWQARARAATQFRLTLAEAAQQIDMIRKIVPPRLLPELIIGTLLQPDGTGAERVQIELNLEGVGSKSYRSTISDNEGKFRLSLPGGTAFPADKILHLTVRGSTTMVAVNLEDSQVAANGFVGWVKLPKRVDPLASSIVENLRDLLPSDGSSEVPVSTSKTASQPQVAMGEDGRLIYRSDVSVDRYPFSIFVRLVEPRTSIVSPVIKLWNPGGKKFWPTPDYFPLSEDNDVEVDYVDRVPVDQPISVDGFRDQLTGVGDGTTVSSYETVALAGTLGLGYLVRMAQSWTPRGLALGNLVYSLPLAPGEQQRVAIFERRDISAVRETETLTEEESARFEQLTDASTDATFASAFSEVARGGSSFATESENWSSSCSFIIFSAGGGGSSSSGTTSNWLSGQRSYSSRAAEDVRTAVERQASARRRATRTSMRLATASESANVITKVITNHNHTRALTLQYWEVLRLFDVSTAVEGATLVCLIPLEVIRFLPAGQSLLLTTTTAVDTRPEILSRYAQVLKHTDIFELRLPRRYQYGLTLLRQFAADPTATFLPAGSAAQDVIHCRVTGTFLPFEEIFVSAITKRGTRIGPVRLVGKVNGVPDVNGDPASSFPTQDSLMAYLLNRRSSVAGFTLEGDVSVPPALARNDVVGFELTRHFNRFDYDLVNPIVHTFLRLKLTPTVPPDHLVKDTVHLSPLQLEQEIGGPLIWGFDARIQALGGSAEETYTQNYLPAFARQELPPGAFPIPAVQLAPVLRYSQLLEIEQMLQHILRNTVHYSKAVWQSMTAEERAIMLEGFTIGVPPGGIEDETQDVPLLNCVENRVLGFYGNSMIMPFMIPRQVADALDISNAQIQDTLVKFHENGFSYPEATVALPTRGVLGEAVLGNCPSAEKIDLTRFWNWADSPSDVAPEIAPVQVPTSQPLLTAGMQAPSALPGIQPLINNINANPTAPGADAALLSAMVKAASEQKGFDSGLTGAEQLAKLILGEQQTADKARADAFKTTRELSAQTIATIGNIVGGKSGNPTAGSSAAGAVYGTEKKEEKKPEDSKPPEKKTEEKKTEEKKTEEKKEEKPK